MPTVNRKLTFVAWADALKKQPFDYTKACIGLAKIQTKDQVVAHDDALTAVDHVKPGTGTDATELQLLALHDADNAPSEWGPGAGAKQITIGKGSYAAFFTHVLIWPDNIAAFDAHVNAPGLGRLAEYLRQRTAERVMFRALYEQGLKEQLADLAGYRSFEYGIHDPHKKAAIDSSGMAGSILPKLWQRVPSIRTKIGMSRRGRRDAYLPPDIANEVIGMTDAAEQFFDALIVRGPSKTQKTQKGNPKQVEVNLLSQRLRVSEEITRDPSGGNLPERSAVFTALRHARRELDKTGKLEAAQEARIVLEQKG